MKTDYQKINTLFLRDEHNIIMPDHFTSPVFEQLQSCKWECTEKIDGTNIHIDVIAEDENNINIKFCGRTEKADIPKHLLAKLQSIFTENNIRQAFNLETGVASDGISIYGEGYGMKIQKGGNYISNDVGFILFDVKVGRWWLNRQTCKSIAEKLGVPIVPLMGYMTIPEAIDFVKQGFKSTIAENKDYEAEGLVLKTPEGLLFRNGERIITKLKTCDFRKYKSKYGDGPAEQKVSPKYNQ